MRQFLACALRFIGQGYCACFLLNSALSLTVLCLSAHADPVQLTNASEVDVEFVAGLAELENGRPEAAISSFTGILSQHPNLTRVRLELARAFFEAEQWQNARSEFVRTLSAELPPLVRTNVEHYIRNIDERRGLNWSTSIAISELRSNPEYRSDAIQSSLLPEGHLLHIHRPNERAIGLSFSSSARLTQPTPSFQFENISTSAFVEAITFGSVARHERLRDVSLGLKGGLQFIASRSMVTVAVSTTGRFVGGQRFSDETEIEIFFEQRGAHGASVFGAAGFMIIDDALSARRDGHAVSGHLGLQHGIDGHGTLGVVGFGEVRQTEFEFDSTNRFGVTVYGRAETRFGLTFSSSMTLAQRSFFQANPAFVNDPTEFEFRGRVRIERADLLMVDGFTPYLEIEAGEVQSDIEAFSYPIRNLRIGLRRVF